MVTHFGKISSRSVSVPLNTEPILLNLGPHHPSTHGVFRLRLIMDGEIIEDAEPVMGYMHRGSEKLAEERTYTQIITLTDRLDWLSGMSNNLAYVRTVEKLSDVEVPERAQYIRVISVELMRIASHCMALGFLINDLGAFATPLMYMFREREKILDLLEMLCGARITFSYMRIGGISHDLPEEFLPALRDFVDQMPKHIDEYDELLTKNEIIQTRAKGQGLLSAQNAVDFGVTGPNLRASGVKWDLRKSDPYEVYDRFEFDIPVGDHGDNYDRYWVRLQEMRESLKIISQAMEQIPGGLTRANVPFFVHPPAGEAYSHIEAPKGHLGFYIVSDGTISPWRCKIRSPSFINLGALASMIIGSKLADVVVTFGSLDTILGQVDR